MENDSKPSPAEAAAQIERDAWAVADAIRNISRPSDVTDVIGALKRTQQLTATVYAALAAWHHSVELGVHHAGEEEPEDPQNPGWVRAEVALEEASQYANDAAAALERARRANTTASWFDEIRRDG